MDALDREQAIEQRLRNMPRSFRATYRKAVEGKSLRSSVNAQCHECMGHQREAIATCTDYGCPLWAVRPYRRSQNA